MPGELDNPDESQTVGYYEHRYEPKGEPYEPQRGMGTWDEFTPEKKKMFSSIMGRIQDNMRDTHLYRPKVERQ